MLFEKFDHFSNLSQQHTTCRNRVAKRAQHAAPDNVAICCVEMLLPFGLSDCKVLFLKTAVKTVNPVAAQESAGCPVID